MCTHDDQVGAPLSRRLDYPLFHWQSQIINEDRFNGYSSRCRLRARLVQKLLAAPSHGFDQLTCVVPGIGVGSERD
ncbi:hypothetical protein D9M68_910950 [compost metagenome]